jgi:hypothetical protein
MFWFHLIACLMMAASFQVMPLSSGHCGHPSGQQNVNKSVDPQPAPKTVQVSVSANADVLITNADGKRIGVDFHTGKFVNEIPDARLIDGAGMAPFVLPYDKAGKPYVIMVTGKTEVAAPANLSMTGPGFVVGTRMLPIRSGLVHTVTISSDGSAVSITASRDGEMPILFMTSQTDRTKPSYRFEIGAAWLSGGKTLSLELNSAAGQLAVKSSDTKQLKLSIQMRRTNPGGSRDTFSHRNVPFISGYKYALDFGRWDGKSDIRFCRAFSPDDWVCPALKNEAPVNPPN